jgi:glycosyltransferase involved in cell wall biosynthesis
LPTGSPTSEISSVGWVECDSKSTCAYSALGSDLIWKRHKTGSSNCVVMIGTSENTMGGIATVVQGYREAGLFNRYNVRYIVTHGDGSVFYKAWLAVRAYAHILPYALNSKARLFHLHLSSRASFWRKLPIAWLLRFLRRPYILHLHGSEFMQFYRDECSAMSQSIVRGVFDNAAIVFALSPEWRANIQSFSSNHNIRVFPNGVPVPETAPVEHTTSDSPPRLLFLGRLGERKGIFDLLEALSRIRNQATDFFLVAAGDGERQQVLQMARTLQLERNIELPGWIDSRRKIEELQRTDVFVLPSRAEGLPMSLLEAMAAGLPVLSTTVGGIPLAVTNDKEGLLVEPGDITELADKLGMLLRSPELRRRLGRNAWQRARADFSVGSCVRKLGRIYEDYEVYPEIDTTNGNEGARAGE